MTSKDIFARISVVLTFVGVLVSVLIGGFFAVYIAGQANGRDSNQAVTDLYKGQLEVSQRELASAREQVTALKLDLQRKVDPQPNIELAAARPGCPADPEVLERLLHNSAPAGISLSVSPGETSAALDAQLFVSVKAISFATSPIRYVASLTLGSPEQANLSIDQVEVGAVLHYQGYEVRVLAISAVAVGFSVTKP